MKSKFVPRFWHPYFLLMMECLGIGLFKQYWPVHGSFWNYRHIDPTNNNDLDKIIHDSWERIQVHIAPIFLEILVVGMFVVIEYIPLYQAIKYLPVALSIHIIAILIGGYNIIRANYRKLKNGQEVSKSEPPPKELIEIYRTIDGYDGYCVRYHYNVLSPILPTMGQAERFRDFIYQKWGREDYFKYSEIIFLEGSKQIYKDYLKSLV